MNSRIILLGLSILLLAFSCEKNNNCEGATTPVGQWKLVAEYLDPGDGSGDYQGVDSDRELTINDDGTFISNKNLCEPFGENSAPSTGMWSDTTSVSWATGELVADDCEVRAYWQLIDDGCTLQLSYLCIEGCGQRFERQ